MPLGKASPAPGVYFTPYCAEMKQMNEPAVKKKFEDGPVAIITYLPKGSVVLPKHLALWFLFSVFVSFLAAYVARHTLQPGAVGVAAMRVTGTVAFAGYGLSHVSNSIWKGQPWGNTLRALFDGAIYAVLTGATFCLLWPSA